MKQKSGIKIWKALGFFLLSYLFLSIPINKKPLFDYLYFLTSPATTPMYTAIKTGTSNGWRATEHFTAKLFSNSVPSENNFYADSVKNKTAGIEKENIKVEISPSSDREEPYTDQEKASIEKALQEN